MTVVIPNATLAIWRVFPCNIQIFHFCKYRLHKYLGITIFHCCPRWKTKQSVPIYNRNSSKWVESWCDASSDRQWVYPCKRSCHQQLWADLATSPQSDLARYIFKDPYNFSFIGTVALQNELDIEKSLTSKITDFLLEMGRGFAYIGRQYHISVDGDDYYIDLLMLHRHCHRLRIWKILWMIWNMISKIKIDGYI